MTQLGQRRRLSTAIGFDIENVINSPTEKYLIYSSMFCMFIGPHMGYFCR